MNLRDLKYIVAVADSQHFGRAAEICHITQPTLSAQIKKLEEFLGVAIFERSHKGVLLTPVGAQIVSKARIILKEVESLRDLAHSSGDPHSGSVKLGIIPTLAPYLLPLIVPALRKHFPKLSLLLYEKQTQTLLEQVKEGQLDGVILALPVDDEGLTTQMLFHEKFFVALPSKHHLQNKTQISVKDIEEEPLLLLEEGHCLRQQALEVCHRNPLKQKTNFSATSLETLRQMVAAEAGITLLPELATRVKFPNDEGIAIRHFPSPEPTREIALLWRNTSSMQSILREMGEVIQGLGITDGDHQR